ncbi:MAG TPA: endonuclease/exonuclease/phosphatase family protein [Bryobacteraceae bacterium]|nr:endonuclease/exonuclease/phosphatase family protein [Bryobacteraceae bacterium]
MRLRIATYNVHKCKGLDGRVSVQRIQTVLEEVGADILALQEIFYTQAEHLAAALGWHWAFGENRQLLGDAYGNVVLSRHALRSHCNYDVTVPGRENRGCLRTDVFLHNRALHVFNVHLGTAFFERRRQAKHLIDEAVLRCRTLDGPRIVLGDFNEWTRGQVSRTLAKEFQSTDVRVFLKQVRTYPGVFPVMHLDHIYYDPQLTVEHVALHRTRTSLVASDHLPLVADFRLQ